MTSDSHIIALRQCHMIPRETHDNRGIKKHEDLVICIVMKCFVVRGYVMKRKEGAEGIHLRRVEESFTFGHGGTRERKLHPLG